MKRPELKQFNGFEKIEDYPLGTYHEAGFLTVTNDSYRSFDYFIDKDKCKNCLECYLYCPDGTIEKQDSYVSINQDFCKGCGICQKICSFDAIERLTIKSQEVKQRKYK